MNGTLTPRQAEISAFITRELLPGTAVELTATTPLLDSGLLNSLLTLRLLTELEARYGTGIAPEAVMDGSLNTLAQIEQYLTAAGGCR